MIENVFITGAHGDIGKSIREIFLLNGFNVISPSSLELDLSNASSIDNYFSKNNLRISILIYCAGINDPKSFNLVTETDVLKTMEVNTFSFFRLIQRVTPFMIEENRGYIAGISSLYSFLGRNGRIPYAMSKHAMNGLMKTLAIELGCYNILVNNISPGIVDTELTRKNNSQEKIRLFEQMIPLARLATPNDIAEIVYFLCSAKNRYITGQNIVVDGGFSIGGFQN